jgi:hypothetical protein
VRLRDPGRDYLVLAQRLDRLLPGTVDTYTGDTGLIGMIQPGLAPDPGDLVRAAGSLADNLPADLGSERARFLRGQLHALEWTARRLTGQAVPYVDEVAAAFDTRIALGSEDAYRRAHRQLERLLPGSGPLTDRLAVHRGRDEIPRERIGAALGALSEGLGEHTRAVVPLPAAEAVEYRVVDDAPWSALHRYLGGFRSRITVNAGARPRRAQLAQLVAHEAYPGHHTERCRKEAGLVARGWEEHRVVLANSPQSLIAEGAAELGLHAVLGPGWGGVAAEVLAGVGLGFDGELAEQVDAATAALTRVRQDAAIMLHGHRAPEAEVLAHLRRWMLVDDARAHQVLRFLRHPLWRSYTTTYVEGSDLMRRWWDLEPRPERFRRLLDEPLTPGVLRKEIAADAVGRPASERVTTSTLRTTDGRH